MTEFTAINILGWLILWGFGMILIPFLMGIVVTFLTKGDAELGGMVFYIGVVSYWLATAIILVMI